MQRTLLLAAVLSATVSVAQADHDRVKWDGAMRVTAETAACGGQYSSPGNERARFHPQFESETPQSSFTRFGGGGAEIIENFDDGQFNGTGAYSIRWIRDGQFFKSLPGEGSPQYYEFVQSPAVISETTVFVSLNGRLFNYIELGCTLTLRGTFVRVDAETGP